MGLVRTFTGYRPGARYDDKPWTQVRIDEAAASAGPWTTIDTLALDPIDLDPTAPSLREFTTEEGTLADGWYRVVFLDADGDQQFTDAVHFPAQTAVVSFHRVRPPARHDGIAWTEARVDEADDEDGPWSAVETLALDPVDVSAARPRRRSLTSALGASGRDWFRVVWVDVAGHAEIGPVLARSGAHLRPTVEQIAKILRVRTKDGDGNDVATFTDETTPTGDAVEGLIQQAIDELHADFGSTPPLEFGKRIRAVTALRAATLVEEGYYAEQTGTDTTVYQTLIVTYRAEMARLINAIQLQDLFAEGGR